MYIPFNIIARFLTPILFVLYILFDLVEVSDASKFMLVVICKIVTVKVDCDWSRLYVVLFWGYVAYISASSSTIEFSCSGRVRLSFPLTLSW